MAARAPDLAQHTPAAVQVEVGNKPQGMQLCTSSAFLDLHWLLS